VPYAQDELVLLVPSNHELAQRGSIEKCELYNLDFVSLNQGSSVQVAQEETLLQQGIKWHKLNTHMVGLCSSPHATLHAGQQVSLRPAHGARMHCFVPNGKTLVCNSYHVLGLSCTVTTAYTFNVFGNSLLSRLLNQSLVESPV